MEQPDMVFFFQGQLSKGNSHCAFTDSRGASLHRPMANIAGREHSGKAAFQIVGLAIERPCHGKATVLS
jgi:hypothetical protein